MAGDLGSIDFWDVGQGDCSVLHLSDGSVIIIDTGPGSSPVVDWLAKGRPHIHAIVLTHNDADHVGALTSVVHAHAANIDAVYMLDHPRNEPKFQELFDAVFTAQKKHRFIFERAEKGKTIWESPAKTEKLEILHPDFVEQITKKKINDLSALVVLTTNGKIVSIWPGDLYFSTLVRAVGEVEVDMLVGPHHGGVQDSKKELKAREKNLRPKEVFISVGSLNIYDHPRSPYLKSLVKKGCSISCSEITSKCDIDRVSQNLPVFDGSGMLGLPANGSGVSCRGTRRLRFSNWCLEGSKLDLMHLQEIRQLREPLCQRPNS